MSVGRMSNEPRTEDSASGDSPRANGKIPQGYPKLTPHRDTDYYYTDFNHWRNIKAGTDRKYHKNRNYPKNDDSWFVVSISILLTVYLLQTAFTLYVIFQPVS